MIRRRMLICDRQQHVGRTHQDLLELRAQLLQLVPDALRLRVVGPAPVAAVQLGANRLLPLLLPRNRLLQASDLGPHRRCIWSGVSFHGLTRSGSRLSLGRRCLGISSSGHINIGSRSGLVFGRHAAPARLPPGESSRRAGLQATRVRSFACASTRDNALHECFQSFLIPKRPASREVTCSYESLGKQSGRPCAVRTACGTGTTSSCCSVVLRAGLQNEVLLHGTHRPLSDLSRAARAACSSIAPAEHGVA